MIFSFNWLQSFFKKKLPAPNKLAELLTMHSFEVESIAKVGQDYAIGIDVLPNRAPDCFSHIGVAKEISALLKIPLQEPSTKFKQGNTKIKDLLKVEVKNKQDCSCYTAKIVLGVKVGQAPKFIKDRLKTCGLQSINNIVDIGNYVMLELGQPIHAFDYNKLAGKQKKIIVRRAKPKEKIKALDDKTYSLSKNNLVIADEKQAIAIAGIKGGESTGVDKKTKNIIVEAANFSQPLIRSSSKELCLRTDASMRFENGIDSNLIDKAQARICSLIQEIAGGKTVQGVADTQTRKIPVKKIKLDLNYVESLLGIKIPKAEIKKILSNLNFKCIENTSRYINVVVPTYRLDLNIQEDLIEEIGRIYGFQNIPAQFPQVSLTPPQKNETRHWENVIRNNLKELGFTEVYNYSFISKKDKENLPLGDMVELANPISSLFQYLRPTLLVNLLKNIKTNINNFDRIAIFEIGNIFSNKETKMLSAALYSKNQPDNLFYELKGVCDILLNRLGISDTWYDEFQSTPEQSQSSFWEKGKCAEIKAGQKEIGFLGAISNKVGDKTGVKNVVAFDFNLKELVKYASGEQEFQPLSQYPAAVRDIAALVPTNTKVADVLNVINTASTNLLKDVDLFDMYEGEGLPQGKKNLAFHLIFQSQDKTLKSKEIDALMQKIIKALEKKPSWEIRK